MNMQQLFKLSTLNRSNDLNLSIIKEQQRKKSISKMQNLINYQGRWDKFKIDKIAVVDKYLKMKRI